MKAGARSFDCGVRLSRNSKSKQLSGACFRASSLVFSLQQKGDRKAMSAPFCTTRKTARFSGKHATGAFRSLQNLFTHIRKLPHFDTRFGVAQERCSPLQKRVFSVCAGRSFGAFWPRAQNLSERKFFGSKRVSKWGNFLISINFFCKQRSGFKNP